MCGIAGIIQRDPSTYSEVHLKKMMTSLAHRGPDDEGHWTNETENVLLGSRRLSIIDLSAAGKQPLHYRDRYTIIHNGEIYNYIELRDELKKKGYSFQTQTDTEVIAAAFDFWNDACLDEFDGMFAFAIWDEKEKELFIARDRFGEKPFYYYSDNNRFLFVSEMKALWSAGIARTPNLKMLFNFITIGYVDNPAVPGETFFENILRLPAASFLRFSLTNFNFSIEKFWELDAEDQDPSIKEKDALEQFNELFNTSVKRRLRSDVSIGTSLSGGIDSSSVIAALSNSASSLNSFTASFPGYEKDESGFASTVANHFGLPNYTVIVTADGLVNDWEKLLYCQEEPFGSASIYAQFKVYELAAEMKTKVLLDGQGADEILAGYHKYYNWYWQELFHKRRLLRSGELKAAKRNGVNERFGFKNVMASLFPDLASVILERQYLLKALRHEDLNREFVRLQSTEAYYTTPALFNLNGALHFNTCTHGLEELLRYADRNSMIHGREARLPFLQHELVEFIFSLPSKFKINDGWTKWLLRKNMDGRLPQEITWRKDKTGFEPPQAEWMQHPTIREMIHEAKKKLVNEKILHSGVLEKPVRALSAHEAGNYDWRYLSAGMLFENS